MPATKDIDWRLFFTGPRGVRKSLFGGEMDQQQVDGINRVCKLALDEYELPAAHVAYILATVYHETGRRMHPVRETFATSDKQAVSRLEHAYKHGRMPYVKNPYWRSDPSYFGRGEVQLTHKSNYWRMDKVVRRVYPDVDIVTHPNLIIDRPEVSTLILVDGMVNGAFTGKKLRDYGDGLPKFEHDEARAIINPHEYSSYDIVGQYSRHFLDAFTGAIR